MILSNRPQDKINLHIMTNIFMLHERKKNFETKCLR